MHEPEYRVRDLLDYDVAEYLTVILAEQIKQQGVAAIVLAGGGTPLDIYRNMHGAMSALKDEQWARLHVFWGDERLVPPDHPESNFGQAWEALLRHVPIPPDNIHRIKGELPAAEAVADYTEQLRAWAAEYDPDAPNPWPRFGPVLLGIGEDGHTASLFPGSPVEADAPVIAVTAEYGGRPAERVTLTPLVFNDAKWVIFLASGPNKAQAVLDALFGEDDPVRYPTQRIRPSSAGSDVMWFLDKAAARYLDWHGSGPYKPRHR